MLLCLKGNMQKTVLIILCDGILLGDKRMFFTLSLLVKVLLSSTQDDVFGVAVLFWIYLGSGGLE